MLARLNGELRGGDVQGCRCISPEEDLDERRRVRGLRDCEEDDAGCFFLRGWLFSGVGRLGSLNGLVRRGGVWKFGLVW